jgi:hypothetical protein
MVWPNGDTAAAPMAFAGKVTSGPVCNPAGAGYYCAQANYRSFLGIYKFFRTACGAAMAA